MWKKKTERKKKEDKTRKRKKIRKLDKRKYTIYEIGREKEGVKRI